MATIVPTITTDDPKLLQENLQKFVAFSKRIQIDMSDGTFATTMMVPLDAMEFPAEAKIDLHLMTAQPSQYLSRVLELKPNLCIVHAEATEDLLGFAQSLKEADIKFGVALLKTTYPRRARQLIAEANHVMIFAGSLGAQGGVADMLQIEKVPLIRALKPDVEIGWDGGANLSNVRALAHSGIDVINVGSAITNAPDPSVMYKELVDESERKGVLL